MIDEEIPASPPHVQIWLEEDAAGGRHVNVKTKAGMETPDLVLVVFGFLTWVRRRSRLDPAEIVKAWVKFDEESP